MTAASATGRRAQPRGQGGEQRFIPANLEEVAERLQAIRDFESREEGKPERRLDRRRLENRDRLYRALCRKAFGPEGQRFKTTITQLAAASGYPMTGNRREDEQRCGNQVRRALADLETAGLIQWSGVKWPNGQWRCIEVCMPDTPLDITLQGDITTIIVRWKRVNGLPLRLFRPIRG